MRGWGWVGGGSVAFFSSEGICGDLLCIAEDRMIEAGGNGQFCDGFVAQACSILFGSVRFRLRAFDLFGAGRRVGELDARDHPGGIKWRCSCGGIHVDGALPCWMMSYSTTVLDTAIGRRGMLDSRGCAASVPPVCRHGGIPPLKSGRLRDKRLRGIARCDETLAVKLHVDQSGGSRLFVGVIRASHHGP